MNKEVTRELRESLRKLFASARWMKQNDIFLILANRIMYDNGPQL